MKKRNYKKWKIMKEYDRMKTIIQNKNNIQK